MMSTTLKKGDEIVITDMEHHSNMLPWRRIAKQKKLKIKYIPLKELKLDMKAAQKIITKKTKIVACTHVSNVIGTINPIKELTDLAHKVGAIVVIDAAQSAPHIKLDVK